MTPFNGDRHTVQWTRVKYIQILQNHQFRYLVFVWISLAQEDMVNHNINYTTLYSHFYIFFSRETWFLLVFFKFHFLQIISLILQALCWDFSLWRAHFWNENLLRPPHYCCFRVRPQDTMEKKHQKYAIKFLSTWNISEWREHLYEWISFYESAASVKFRSPLLLLALGQRSILSFALQLKLF